MRHQSHSGERGAERVAANTRLLMGLLVFLRGSSLDKKSASAARRAFQEAHLAAPAGHNVERPLARASA